MNKVTILKKGDIIFCKKQPFVIIEEGYTDHYTSGAMANILQATDSEFETLQEKVRTKNQSEVETL